MRRGDHVPVFIEAGDAAIVVMFSPDEYAELVGANPGEFEPEPAGECNCHAFCMCDLKPRGT